MQGHNPENEWSARFRELFTLPHVFLEESQRNLSLPDRNTRIPPGIVPQPLSIKWL